MKLREFFRLLDDYPESIPIDRLVQWMRDLEIGRGELDTVIGFDEECYQRNVLRVGSGYAALVLCWRPGQASPIHDHHGSACGVLVLSGRVTETRYEQDRGGRFREVETGSLGKGCVCGSFDADTHVIRNAEVDRNLVTLHVYTPPLRDYRIYEPETFAVTMRTDTETLAAQRAAGLL